MAAPATTAATNPAPPPAIAVAAAEVAPNTWHARLAQAPATGWDGGGDGGSAAAARGDARASVISGAACRSLQAGGDPLLAAASCRVINPRSGTLVLRWADGSGVSVQQAAAVLQQLQQAGGLRWFERAGPPLRAQTVASRDAAVQRSLAFDQSLAVPATATLPALARARAWNALSGVAPEVVVAVVDSGIDFADPALADLAWRNPLETAGNGRDDDGNGLVDDVQGWDFVDAGFASLDDDTAVPDNDPADRLGHGTAVARVLADAAAGGVRLRLMALRVAFGLQGQGVADPAAVAQAIVYATDHGAQVINISLGSTQRQALLSDAVADALARGVVVVAAAGNTGGPVLYPAAEPGVLAVGALDTDGRPLLRSAQGPGVDLYAPGQALASDAASVPLAGTSMAAPRVAALAALLLAPHLGPGAGCAERRARVRTDLPLSQQLDDWVSHHLRSTEALPPQPTVAAWASRQTDCGRPVAPLGRLARAAR